MNNKKIKTAVLISGRGSNLEALINACKDKKYPAEIAVVISNKENAAGLKIAQVNKIKTAFLDHKDFGTREEFDRRLTKIIEENHCEVICLAGFMRLLSGEFVKKWFNRIINIHPSLLPAFKGNNPVEDALNYGVRYSGCTTHLVREEMDTGPVIKQAVVEVLESDTRETLASRILQKEHIIYKESLAIICKKILEQNK